MAVIHRKRIDPDWAWQPFEPNQQRPWDRRLAAHLHRRAGFSATSRKLQRAVNNGFEATLDDLFDIEQVPEYGNLMDQSARHLVTANDPRRLSSWWILRMANSPNPLREKMTLFWHSHFATSGQKVNDVSALLAQNLLLRKHALGKFEPLVQGVSRDVAMLTYLDSTSNRKTRPNENYARELLELFCLGLDNYTEQDIKEIARCFTGWEIRRVSGVSRFKFNPQQHDDGVKSFLGESGKFGGEDAVRIALRQNSATDFIAKKLVRFFVFDDVEITSELVQPIAQTLRDSDFDIGQGLRQILSSNLFFSDQSIGQKIRSPVELVVGLLHQFAAKAKMDGLMEQMELLGQLPFFPPNVKGWVGGRKWLNASTLLARSNLVDAFARQDGFSLRSGSFEEWASEAKAPRGNEGLVEWLAGLMFSRELDSDSRAALVGLARQQKTIDQKISSLLTAMGMIPAFHLS